jgi:hypothetical protein
VTTPCCASAVSLRTRIIVVTVVGCWLGYAVNWIRQRHAVLECPVNCSTFVIPVEAPSAPGLLWIFGERGVADLSLMLRRSDPKANRISSLFPEAVLTFYVEDKRFGSNAMPFDSHRFIRLMAIGIAGLIAVAVGLRPGGGSSGRTKGDASQSESFPSQFTTLVHSVGGQSGPE